jgi:D-inositol-3-phosphate glycosyltransferase
VYLADLSGALARRGHRVTFHTRRDDPDLPERVETRRGYNVVQVSAGPPRRLSDDEVLPAMGPFARSLAATWTRIAPISRMPTSGCPVSRPSSWHANSTCLRC